jgi:hypothetical protein
MVKVHVWLPNGKYVGHAALTVGDDYISFWPDGGAEKKDLKIKRSQPGRSGGCWESASGRPTRC